MFDRAIVSSVFLGTLSTSCRQTKATNEDQQHRVRFWHRSRFSSSTACFERSTEQSEVSQASELVSVQVSRGSIRTFEIEVVAQNQKVLKLNRAVGVEVSQWDDAD